MAKEFDVGLGQDFSEVYRQSDGDLDHSCGCGCGEGPSLESLPSEERWLVLLDALEALAGTGWSLETFDTKVHPETGTVELVVVFGNPATGDLREETEDD